MDLVIERQKKIEELNKALKSLPANGISYASAYKNYRILLAKELLRLKADGMPVTIAYDIARGNEEVAEAKFQELATEAVYKANLESINSIKLELKIIENQFNKEYCN